MISVQGNLSKGSITVLSPLAVANAFSCHVCRQAHSPKVGML